MSAFFYVTSYYFFSFVFLLCLPCTLPPNDNQTVKHGLTWVFLVNLFKEVSGRQWVYSVQSFVHQARLEMSDTEEFCAATFRRQVDTGEHSDVSLPDQI